VILTFNVYTSNLFHSYSRLALFFN